MLNGLSRRLDRKLNSLYITQNIIQQKHRHKEWLENFPEGYESLASHLLYSFIFVPDTATDIMLVNALMNLSTQEGQALNMDEWVEFVRSLYFTPVRDRTFNPSDSGNLFVGKVKKLMPIEEEKIIGESEDILEKLSNGNPVVMIDDFLGSGDQAVNFISSLGLKNGDDRLERLYYPPLVATKRGGDVLKSVFPHMKYYPLFEMDERYSVLSDTSVFWKGLSRDVRNEKIQQIIDLSSNLGIEDGDIFGHKELGLGIAFQHGVPDATIPLFTHRSHIWTPLVGE